MVGRHRNSDLAEPLLPVALSFALPALSAGVMAVWVSPLFWAAGVFAVLVGAQTVYLVARVNAICRRPLPGSAPRAGGG